MTRDSKVLPLKRPAGAGDMAQDKYVCIRRMRDDGFVEFDFSIGDPGLYVELILPTTAFNEFCNSNGVIFLDGADSAAIEADRKRWREGFISQEGDEVKKDDMP